MRIGADSHSGKRMDLPRRSDIVSASRYFSVFSVYRLMTMNALPEHKYKWTVQCHSMAQLSTEVLGFWRTSLSLQPNLRHAFMTPTYCQAVDACIDGEVRVLLVYRDERMVALLPVQPGQRYPRWSGIWEPVGGAMCDYFGFIYQDDSIQLNVIDLMRKAGIGAIEYSHLDETQLMLGLPMGTPRVGLRTVISGDGSLDWEQLRSKNKKLVTDTERRERKLVSDHGPLTFELQSTQPEADLKELVDLKREQYKRTGQYEAVLFDAKKVLLLQKMLSTRSPECSGLLSVLRVNGNMVAAHFGLHCDKVLHFWFPVYSEKFAAYSPGRILYKYVITEGKVAGISTIDRGEGDTPAKREFSTHEHHFIKGVWWNKSAHGLVARGILSLSWRIGMRNRDGRPTNKK
jgi:CelD/BcsL family acetyltransferase involved in cellulose biosynthesis